MAVTGGGVGPGAGPALTETPTAPQPPILASGRPAPTLQRTIISWSVVFLLLGGAFISTVAILNATLYSATGFVSSYLNSLARHDVDSVLAMPGVSSATAAGVSDELLVADALGELGGIRITDDSSGDSSSTETTPAARTITAEYLLDGTASTTTFEVVPDGSRFLFFDRWQFRESPTSVVTITPSGVPSITVNRVSISVADDAAPASYLVLTPSLLELGHDSARLTSEPSSVLVSEVGSTTAGTVIPRAKDSFVDLLQEQLDTLLDECVNQTVLQPTGCPYGQSIDDRVVGTPAWTIVDYPDIDIVRGDAPGEWIVPEVTGAAHLAVEVQSLFDGSRFLFDEDVPFTVGYRISLADDGGVSITGAAR